MLVTWVASSSQVQFWRSDQQEELFHFGPADRNATLTPDGRYLAWCENHAEKIHLLDIAALRQQLAAISLDW
jgi:hypothetical protein